MRKDDKIEVGQDSDLWNHFFGNAPYFATILIGTSSQECYNIQ